MLADPYLLVQMQLALIGIVLVTGLFYLWRSICRIEDKVTRLALRVNQPPPQQFTSSTGGGSIFIPTNTIPFNDFKKGPVNFVDIDNRTEELMQKVFGDDEDTADADVEVIPVKKNEKLVEVIPPTDIPSVETVTVNDDVSEAETDSANPLSKTKLSRMNHEDLKVLCTQRGLASEGSKKHLVDRLLGLTRD